MNYDLSFVVTPITMTCYSWAPSSGDHLFTCDAIYMPPQYFQHQAEDWVLFRLRDSSVGWVEQTLYAKQYDEGENKLYTLTRIYSRVTYDQHPDN